MINCFRDPYKFLLNLDTFLFIYYVILNDLNIECYNECFIKLFRYCRYNIADEYIKIFCQKKSHGKKICEFTVHY